MADRVREALAAADRYRTHKAFAAACYAPFTSMFLDPHGNVLACCQNSDHPLGNIAEARLVDIWRGARAEALRDALRRDDLSMGCHYCAWQIDESSWETTLAASFDDLAVAEPAPPWPRRLEFALSTTCNLECVMCNGDWSSRIRARREGRPALPKPYGESFFEDLRDFLPHLESARFYGGEPFLAPESLRIMESIIDEGLVIPCHVQTNGTQWNPRVERILEHLPVSITVSLDGVTRATVESIRVGASYDAIMANVDRYKAQTDRWGTNLGVAFCFMAQNWHEFGDFLVFADDLDASVSVVTVVHPSFSPYHLPVEEFDAMLAALDARDAEMRERLGRNLPQWNAELSRLRVWRDRHRVTAGVPVDLEPRRYFQPGPLPAELCEGPTDGPSHSIRDMAHELLVGLPGAQVSVARCDHRGVVVATGVAPDVAAEGFIGVPADDCHGRPWGELAGRVGRRYGGQVAVRREEVVDGACRREVILGDPGREAVYAVLLTAPEHREGRITGSTTVAAWSTTPPSWAPARVR